MGQNNKGLPPASVIYTAEEIDAALQKLAAELQPIVAEGDVVLLGIMMGAMVPLVRISQLLDGDFQLDTCHATRYEAGLEGKELAWVKQPGLDMHGKTVIVFDDIFDQGITLEAVVAACQANGAAKVVSAVLATKDHEDQRSDYRPDFSALMVPNRYVFGYGMDYKHHWRHLPEIYALDEGAE